MIVATYTDSAGIVHEFETREAFEAYVKGLQTPEEQEAEVKQRAIQRLQESREFGWALIDDFTAGNMLLGIAQASPVVAGQLMANTAGIMAALQTGSLYVAIANIRALPESALDGTYLTKERATTFRNKIHQFLNLLEVPAYNT